MLKKKVLVTTAIVTTVLVAIVIAAFAVKFFILDSDEVENSEYFEGITWDMSQKQVSDVLIEKGYNVEKRNTWLIVGVENFGGYDGANGNGIIIFDEEDRPKEILVYFKDDYMDIGKMGDFAETTIKTLENIYEKTMDFSEEYKGDATDSAEYIRRYYVGENSTIGIAYREGVELIISYEPSDSDYIKDLLEIYTN